jgi:hypothetical protein
VDAAAAELAAVPLKNEWQASACRFFILLQRGKLCYTRKKAVKRGIIYVDKTSGNRRMVPAYEKYKAAEAAWTLGLCFQKAKVCHDLCKHGGSRRKRSSITKTAVRI